MTRPEDALALARARAAKAGYDLDRVGTPIEPLETITLEQLLEWSIIDPDIAEVRSTRRFGAPITHGKRLLARLMRQYNAQLLAQQGRFNLQIALAYAQLEQRVRDLEERQG